MWPLFIAYVINFPYYQYQAKLSQAETNFDRQSENLFKSDKRFMGPLYFFVAYDFVTWIWCLCVISQTFPEWAPKFLFEDKISNSLSGWCLFTFVWGYMAGVNGLAGHELIHRRETFNKGLGMFTFSKIFYSHFLLEHSSGHHRNVATPEDSATARVGENFFVFTLRSAIGGHMNTWNREVSRLQTKYECEKVPLITLLTENRMTWFATLQLSIMALIWGVFGTRALIF